MPKKATHRVAVKEEPLIMVQCRACRRHIGYSPRQAVTFCEDIFCALTGEWLFEKDYDADWLVYLHEVEGVPIPDIANLLELDRYQAHALYKGRQDRKLYARM